MNILRMKKLCMKFCYSLVQNCCINLPSLFLSCSLFEIVRWMIDEDVFRDFFLFISLLYAFVLFVLYTIRNNIGMSSVFSRYHHHFKWTVAKWTEFRVAKRIEIDYGAFPFGLFLWINSFDFTLNVHILNIERYIDPILSLSILFLSCIFCIWYYSTNWKLNRIYTIEMFTCNYVYQRSLKHCVHVTYNCYIYYCV